MKTMSKILTVIALVVLCVSLFTLTAFAEEHAATDTIVGTSAEKAATCAEDGSKAYTICSCHNVYEGVYTDAASIDTSKIVGDMAELVIPKDPTKHPTATLPEVAAVAPTCLKDGVKKHYHCDACGKDFSDEAGAIEMTDVKDPKADHEAADTVGTAEVPPTCGKDGTKAYWICQWCGQKISKASGGYVLTDLTIPATGEHDWGEWTEVSKATGTHGGEEQRVCKKCGKTETRGTDAKGIEADPEGSDLFYSIDGRDTYYRGEDLPEFWSKLIQELNDESGPNKNYVGVRIGTSNSMYANTFHTLDFWSYDDTIRLGPDLIKSLDAGTYYIWVYDTRNQDRHTDSKVWHLVDVPTLEPINTDKHVVNSTKNLRFRASEPIKDASVKVGGKTLLDDNYYYVSNDGLTITLSPDFLNERQVGTYTISANTVANNTKVSCPFYILSTASASASPKTGDESQLGLWAAFLLLSGAAVVVLVPKIRKHGA